eukprot:2279136-Pyramimonas_sp.AAC.1
MSLQRVGAEARRAVGGGGGGGPSVPVRVPPAARPPYKREGHAANSAGPRGRRLQRHLGGAVRAPA